MTFVSINKLLVLDLLGKYNYEVTQGSIMEVTKLIEGQLNVKFQHPVSAKLHTEIETKLICLTSAWSKLSTDIYKEMFRKEMGKRFFKIKVPAADLADDSIIARLEVIEEMYNDTKTENFKLDKKVKELNAELDELKAKLNHTSLNITMETNKHASLRALETIAQAEQVSAMATIELQAKLTGKQKTIRNIISEPDILEIIDCTQPTLSTSCQGNQSISASSPASTKYFSNFLFQTQKRLEYEKLKELDKEAKAKFKNHKVKISKLKQRQNYYLVSARQKARIKSQIKETIAESTNFLKTMGLCLASVEINPIELDDPDYKLKIFYPEEERGNEESIEKLLYFKDKHSISDRCYCDLKSKCLLKIPSLHKLIQFRNKIDSMFEIHNNEMGVFMSVEEKLRFRIDHFFKRKYKNGINDPDTVFKDPIIHIKLGADGTNIGRNLKLLNFTFTIINEGAVSKTASGNYTLGIFEIESENYGSVTECFKELIEEFANLNTMKVQEKELTIIYYYAGDWKMLANSLGILGANSKYPCVWCKCPKDNFYDSEQEWSITNPIKGARTHEEQAAILSHSNIKDIVNFGYTRVPIFKDIIPISRYMIDMLHLFLRISDTLFNLLVKDCSLADNFDMGAIYKFDVALYKHMNSLQHFLNEKCNVKFSFFWVAETKKLQWRDLVGPEKVRLFENLNLSEIIPDHEKFNSVSAIWSNFYDILQDVKEVKVEPAELKVRTKEWLDLFLTVYNKTTVTPYMHAFVFHLHEFVHLYKDINAFNCQGLEKLNDISTGHYFKSTNKGATALHQMLKKRNRMEYLSQYLKSNAYDD